MCDTFWTRFSFVLNTFHIDCERRSKHLCSKEFRLFVRSKSVPMYLPLLIARAIISFIFNSIMIFQNKTKKHARRDVTRKKANASRNLFHKNRKKLISESPSLTWFERVLIEFVCQCETPRKETWELSRTEQRFLSKREKEKLVENNAPHSGGSLRANERSVTGSLLYIHIARTVSSNPVQSSIQRNRTIRTHSERANWGERIWNRRTKKNECRTRGKRILARSFVPNANFFRSSRPGTNLQTQTHLY